MFSSNPSVFRLFFIMNGYWVSSNDLSTSVDHMFFLFSDTLIYFQMLNQPCIPEINQTWVIVCNSFCMFCIQFAIVSLKAVLSILIRAIIVLFSCNIFPWLWYNGMNLKVIIFLSIFWESFRNIDIISWSVWYNSPVIPSGPELLFIKIFLITSSITYLFWIYSAFLFPL